MPWSQSGNIKGASGQPGASGASGLQGASGVPGATGPTGASGPAGTTTWSGITDKPAVIAAGVDAAAARNVISAEYTGNKGQPSGYAALDASGLVPSSQLPSFVDDVVEAANLAAFPGTGESGKIYTALDTNKVYRWGGSSYVEISASPGSTDAVPEGSTNLYYTAARADGRITAAVGSTVQAYSPTLVTYAGKSAPSGAVVGDTDAQTLTNKTLTAPAISSPTGLVKGDVGLGNVDNTADTAKNVLSATKLTTARTINGVSFDGTANITVPAGIQRSVSTITTSTTFATATNTDYIALINYAPLTAGTSVLIKADGTNNATSFSDSSLNNFTITRVGDTKISTTQSKYGGSSAYFDGTGDYLTISGGTSTTLPSGNGAYTVEAWIYPTSVSTAQAILTYGSASAGKAFRLVLRSSGVLGDFWWGDPPWDLSSSTGAVSANTWQHVAASYDGTTRRLFVNGTQVGSSTGSTHSVDTYNNINIGRDGLQAGLGSSADHFTGYIDDLRLSTVCRYTGNFTPPSSFATSSPSTLPSAALAGSNLYTLKNITSDTVTVNVTSSQLIDGAAGGLTLTAGSAVRLISDGSNWRTV